MKMQYGVQLNLFDQKVRPKKKKIVSEWGTFKDSLKAPVHRWFTYPAGFSYKAVEHSVEQYEITPGQTIYDPFMGSGTTNLVAKTLGINSYGVEAHPFVFQITKAKLDWTIKREEVLGVLKNIRETFPTQAKNLNRNQEFVIEDQFPQLIAKCYESKTLKDLFVLRELILNYDMPDNLSAFFRVVVTALLREISTAATGWPYIAPKKKKVTSVDKDVLTEFSILARRMADDIEEIKLISSNLYRKSWHVLVNGDSRNTEEHIPNESVDFVFTSPPYLNNFDYADRTRLEMYFWGEASSWGDISEHVRTKLMTSATTQIVRSNPRYEISDELKIECPDVASFVETAVTELAERRKTKGGKKSYDLMVAGYFNDIHQIIKDVYRVLKPDTNALFVLGDSAPYGVHIPTDDLIGKIAVGVGFRNYDLEILRTRGSKWKANPQRHSVELRESIVILRK